MKTIIKIETIDELLQATRDARIEGDKLPLLKKFVIIADEGIVRLPIDKRNDIIIPEIDFHTFAAYFMRMYGVSIEYHGILIEFDD